MKFLYHASRIRDLTEISPRVSTHKKNWVYAMDKPEYAMMFIGIGDDFICQTGVLDDGMPVIVERFKGALEENYKNVAGSLYMIDGTNFLSGQTSFSPEYVSEVEADVMTEEYIDDALSYILKLEQEGKMKIYRYPDAPSWIKADKSDIVEKVKRWMKEGVMTKIPENIVKYHPELLPHFE